MHAVGDVPPGDVNSLLGDLDVLTERLTDVLALIRRIRGRALALAAAGTAPEQAPRVYVRHGGGQSAFSPSLPDADHRRHLAPAPAETDDRRDPVLDPALIVATDLALAGYSREAITERLRDRYGGEPVTRLLAELYDAEQ
jgi:hypothetical protein